MRRSWWLVLAILALASAAQAQTNTESQPRSGCTLGAVGHVCAVPMAGQQSAFASIPGGHNLVVIIKPVIALVPSPTAADWLEDRAMFVSAANTVVASLTLSTSADTVEHTIWSSVPALWLGIRITTYTSGSVANAKVWATAQPPAALLLGTQAGVPVPLPINDVSGIKLVGVVNPTAQPTQGYNRQNCTTVINALNGEAKINGAGAGTISAYVDTGRTGNTVFEARNGAGTWFGTPFRKTDGALIQAGEQVGTYPIVGHFSQTGFDEYRVRAATHTSGSHTPCLSLSQGAGIVRAIPLAAGVEWRAQQEYSTAQTDTVLQAAPGSGLSLYITDILVTCGSATAVTVTLEEDDTVDILRFRYWCNGIGNGAAPPIKTPIKFGANRALLVTTSAAQTVFVSVGGYTAP
jgi:hypothetical protein